MTKNRARKRATRQRVSLTGERYVVAQRAATPLPPRKIGRMDALTHRVPGVPAHIDGGHQGPTSRGRNATHIQPRHDQPRRGEPRVLVAWQNWIARRLGAASR